MDALVYTRDGQEYEMLSGILEEELPGLTVSRGVVDREFQQQKKNVLWIIAAGVIALAGIVFAGVSASKKKKNGD